MHSGKLISIATETFVLPHEYKSAWLFFVSGQWRCGMSDQSLEHISSADPDSRYFPRWEVDEQVLCQLEGESETHKGRTKDISCAGACIIGDWQISPHQKIKITIQLSKTATINLSAHILWVKIHNDQQEMGITFYDTPEDVQDSILQYAFELDKEKVLKQWFKGWVGS